MKLADVKHIGVVGGGIMGAGIAQVLAVAGYQVTIRDLTDPIINDIKDSLIEGKWGVKRAVEKGKIGFDTASQVIDLVSFTTDIQDLKNCDVIIEAVPEKLALKQEIFAELDNIIKPEAIAHVQYDA